MSPKKEKSCALNVTVCLAAGDDASEVSYVSTPF